MSGEGDVDSFLGALRQHESGNNYTSRSSSSSASGAYQYIDGTWNNYKGYAHAYQAPRSVQDERARKDVLAVYNKYGNWEAVATVHFTGHYVSQSSAEFNRRPSAGNPTVRDYVASVMSKMGTTSSSGGTGNFDTAKAKRLADALTKKMWRPGNQAANRRLLLQYVGAAKIDGKSEPAQMRVLSRALVRQMSNGSVYLPAAIAKQAHAAKAQGKTWQEVHAPTSYGSGGGPAKTTSTGSAPRSLAQVDSNAFLPRMTNQEYQGQIDPRGTRALEYAAKQSQQATDNWRNYCLRFVRSSLGAPGGTTDANQAIRNLSSLHTDGSEPPAGVPVWFSGGANGHVVLSAGGGMAWTNDVAGSGVISLEPIERIQQWLGSHYTYVGWSEDINGVDVWDAPQTERTDPAIPEWAQPVTASGTSERTGEQAPAPADDAQGSPTRAALTQESANTAAASERASVGAQAGLNDSGAGFNARAAEQATDTVGAGRPANARTVEMAGPNDQSLQNIRDLESRPPSFKPPKQGNVNLGYAGRRSTKTGTAKPAAPVFHPPKAGNINLGYAGRRSTSTGTAAPRPTAAKKAANQKATAKKYSYGPKKPVKAATKPRSAAQKASNQRAVAKKYSYAPKKAIKSSAPKKSASKTTAKKASNAKAVAKKYSYGPGR